jgi:DNA-binding MarR family transcriptional regulator
MTTKTINATELTSTSDGLPALNPPRGGTKQAKLVSMLSRKSGATLVKASETLGWQPHTTSATMTGLRKRGYVIERQDREGKPSIYRIDAEKTPPLSKPTDAEAVE